MKIDIHAHTKKIKQGDGEARNIDAERFSDIIQDAGVGILAITNHNHFDKEQFVSFRDSVNEYCQIWPGIELDIRKKDGGKGHLIVIAPPDKYDCFHSKVETIINDVTPDNFITDFETVVNTFDELEPIYVAHYLSKNPGFSEDDIKQLAEKTKNPHLILKEASNSISAGIYISHGHNSIHGSDVKDWNNYVMESKELPELRLPVESFEQFCLLLKKDDTTIKTLLDKKNKTSLIISPFDNAAELINIDIYNDINILFGSKGTGKTKILESLSRHYTDKGISATVFKSSDKKIEDEYDIKCSNYNPSSESLGIEDCEEEIQHIREVKEVNITNLSSYRIYFENETTNKKARRIKITDYSLEDENEYSQSLNSKKNIFKRFSDFSDFIKSTPHLRDITNEETLDELINTLETLKREIIVARDKSLFEYKSIKLFNNLVNTFSEEIGKKTGRPERPKTTGFIEYARNRLKIEKSVNKIISNSCKQINKTVINIGNLGNKGKIQLVTEVKAQNGEITDGSFFCKHGTKTIQKQFSKGITSISKHIYEPNLFAKINDFRNADTENKITSVKHLLLFYRYFSINNNVYTPSTGEGSMLLLHNELSKDKDIYLIDEPERSLGNDYISDVIVPLIKEKAKSGKIIVIATHDANIAVRTLPYNSIYREHIDRTMCLSYSGNPFSNSLICSDPAQENKDWKVISMKTLEGGKEAFGERGKIYGNL